MFTCHLYLKQKAFTLIEMLITLSVLSILLVQSIYLCEDLLAYYRSSQTLHRLQNSIKFAHIAALHLRQPVLIAANNNDWHNGWKVFIDHNRDHQFSDEDTLLQDYPALHHQEKLTWKGFAQENSIQFGPSFLHLAVNGTFAYCYKTLQMEKGWNLILNRIGRARSIKADCY